jgi:antitoxin (DNA-binding transcriptional repressor) of toxin-antitoxin stability system
MKSMTLREIRNTRHLKAVLKSGTTVELKERNQPLAHIVPIQKPPATREWPDFEARRRNIFGERVLPGADLLIEERGRY